MSHHTYAPGAHLPHNGRIPRRRSANVAIDIHTEDVVTPSRKHRHFSPVAFCMAVSIGFLAVLLAINVIILPFFNNVSNQVKYGDNRISSFDFNVGHGGTSHFIAQVYNGQVIVVELDMPDYDGTVYRFSISRDYDGKVVSIIPEDENHDGKTDLVISVEGDVFAMVLYNTGKAFTDKY